MFSTLRIRRVLSSLHALLAGRDWEPPSDPVTPVREPVPRHPNDRSSAVAVAEPKPESFVQATGRRL
jgi:hypothetical protein